MKFIEGHRRLLELHFGIAKITSSDTAWMHHENTYVIVAESKDREKIYGGARVQLADKKLLLPIETAIAKYDPKIHEMAVPGTSEICGLWNSMEVAGLGIGSIFMARVGVSVANQLDVEKIFFLCAPVTVRIGKRIGGIIETGLGNNGAFFYPKDDFVATAMVIADCKTLPTADAAERDRIFELYNNPVQKLIEKGPKGELEVE
ncbi:MAG: hypothetical protein J7539_07810 [Niabella sp.]|nr:hypothetical protein [Niabella sp.]